LTASYSIEDEPNGEEQDTSHQAFGVKVIASIYLVGPVIGGLLAGALWGYFLEKHEPA
jgi:hypothetical protein